MSKKTKIELPKPFRVTWPFIVDYESGENTRGEILGEYEKLQMIENTEPEKLTKKQLISFVGILRDQLKSVNEELIKARDSKATLYTDNKELLSGRAKFIDQRDKLINVVAKLVEQQ